MDNENEVRPSLPLYAAAGAAAGILNGLCGSGGGTVLYFALGLLGYGAAKDRFAVNIAAVCAMSVVSAALYLAGGRVRIGELLPLFPFAAAGGLLGAYLTDRIPTRYIKLLFSLLIVYAGIRMW